MSYGMPFVPGVRFDEVDASAVASSACVNGCSNGLTFGMPDVVSLSCLNSNGNIFGAALCSSVYRVGASSKWLLNLSLKYPAVICFTSVGLVIISRSLVRIAIRPLVRGNSRVLI